MLKRLLYTLVLLLVCLCCTAAPKKKRNKYKQVTMEGYSIQRCHECDINPPKYQEISEIYHVDDDLTELTFTVAGDCFLKDSLIFSISQDSLIFDFNFIDHSSVVDSIAAHYQWYTVKVILENLEIPNRFKIISNDLEIFISDEIYADYISSSKQTDYGIINVRDYYGNRQGLWIINNCNGFICEVMFEDDIPMNLFHWRKFYLDGTYTLVPASGDPYFYHFIYTTKFVPYSALAAQ